MADSSLPDFSPPGRLQAALFTVERTLRTHPQVMAALTIFFFVVVSVMHHRVGFELPLALTFAGPIALCTYSVGPIAGATTAIAVALVWLGDALSIGIPLERALLLFSTRLFSNLAVVAIAAVASTAIRARERYVEAQQDLARIRSDLVAGFSHDLRSPLTAIIGYADLVRDGAFGPIPTEAAEVLERILSKANQLDQLIGEMLVAGQGDTAVPIQISRFEPAEFVAALRAEFGDTPRGRPIMLTWDVAPQMPPLHTDRTKLTSIVRNLVSNALKFTERGSVTIHFDYDSEAAAHRIEVTDTGPGISAQELPKIFNRFYRVNRPRQTEGFGLGLFIVKRFTELLGGTVAVESQVGRGTRFTVTLPGPPLESSAGGKTAEVGSDATLALLHKRVQA